MCNARIFVGTYAKYNSGSIFGKWFDLEDFADKESFEAACLELHADESDPELMFQDWEGIPESMIGECHIKAEFWELLEAYDEHGEDAVNAYADRFGEWNSSDFLDRYYGQFDSWSDMAYDYVEQSGMLAECPETVARYFDYESFARDLRCGGEMTEQDGFFFFNC